MDVRAELVDEVNKTTLVTATVGGGVNEIFITADTGSGFILTASAANGVGGTLANNAIKTVTLRSESTVC